MRKGFKVWKHPRMEHNKLTKWNWMVSYPQRLQMGKYVDIGAFCYIQAEYGIRLGEGVQLGAGCKIYSKNTINETAGSVVIKRHAKIGANSVVLPNTIIEENQLIPAGSVVFNKHGLTVIRKVL